MEDDFEPLSLAGEQWAGLLREGGEWAPPRRHGAAWPALAGALRRGGLTTDAAADLLGALSGGDGLRDAMSGAPPSDGGSFWTRPGSPWPEIARACAALLGGADVACENAAEVRRRREARRRDEEARAMDEAAPLLADAYAAEVARSQGPRTFDAESRAMRELLRRRVIAVP